MNFWDDGGVDCTAFREKILRDITAGMGIPWDYARPPKKETPELEKIVGGFCSHVSALGWSLRWRNNAYLWNGPDKQVSGTFEYHGELSRRSRQLDFAFVCIVLADALGLTALAAGLREELRKEQEAAA